MKLTGIHFLLSYQCTYECDHCFLWGSPQARGTMTLAQIRNVLQQAKALGRLNRITRVLSHHGIAVEKVAGQAHVVHADLGYGTQPLDGILDRGGPVAIGDDASFETHGGCISQPLDQNGVEQEWLAALEAVNPIPYGLPYPAHAKIPPSPGPG